jgi:probable phosphoglycerate mutase
MLPLIPFYLIRHGESEANAARITAGGRFDSPLTARGRQQATDLAPYLDQLETPPASLYHSPMMRARDTAMILNGAWKLPASPRDDLREHDMGQWDGQPWKDVIPQLQAKVSPPGGESEKHFSERIKTAIGEVLETATAHPPVIVAHGGLFHAIGFMYSYAMSEVNNCHLHYFEPHPEYLLFPWRVWQFDVDGGRLVKSPAPFCSSRAA